MLAYALIFLSVSVGLSQLAKALSQAPQALDGYKQAKNKIK